MVARTVRTASLCDTFVRSLLMTYRCDCKLSDKKSSTKPQQVQIDCEFA